jgi:hypothetical protein
MEAVERSVESAVRQHVGSDEELFQEWSPAASALQIGQSGRMANGKPGDHPLTDVLVHHLPVFNEEVDRLIVELDGVNGWDGELVSFLMLSVHDDIVRLRQEGRHEAVATLLHNLAWVLRSEIQRHTDPGA